jgi:hypothetical protein
LNEKLQEIRLTLEIQPISPSLMMEEQTTFQKNQQIMKLQEPDQRLKSHSILLNAEDRNTKFFHRQAKARLWRNLIPEIRGEGESTILG